jgi:hypothetical protein
MSVFLQTAQPHGRTKAQTRKNTPGEDDLFTDNDAHGQNVETGIYEGKAFLRKDELITGKNISVIDSSVIYFPETAYSISLLPNASQHLENRDDTFLPDFADIHEGSDEEVVEYVRSEHENENEELETNVEEEIEARAAKVQSEALTEVQGDEDLRRDKRPHLADVWDRTDQDLETENRVCKDILDVTVTMCEERNIQLRKR